MRPNAARRSPYRWDSACSRWAPPADWREQARAAAGRVDSYVGVLLGELALARRRVGVAEPGRAGAVLVALAVTVALHLWRRNALVSSVGGTLFDVSLVSLVWSG